MVEKAHVMSTIEVRLPEPLAKRLQEEAVLADDAIVEALEAWLETRRQEQRKRTRQVLLDRGLIMSPEEQRAFANTIRARLSLDREPPSLEEVEKTLADLEPPLSQEIITGRGER